MEGCVPWPEEAVKEYKQKGYWEDIPLGEHFDRWVEQYSDRSALAYRGKEITYRQMGEYVTRLAYHMAHMGIKTYDRVIFQLFNGPEVVYLIYACMKIGAIPICSLPTHRWAEISFFAQMGEARVHAIPAGTVMGFDYEQFADQLRDKIPSLEFVLTVGKPGRPNMVSINELIEKDVDLKKANKELARYRPDPMEPAVFQLSGGTTGVPKIIPRTHNDYYYNAKCCAMAGDFDENLRFLTVAPMTHNAPLVCMILPTHIKGGTVVISSPRIEDILQTIMQNKVNLLPMAAVFAHLMLDVPEEERKKYDLSSVKRLWASTITPEMHLKIRESFHAESDQIYGMAEGLICTTRPSDPFEIVMYTQGRPVSEADEMKIVDPNTREEMPVGQIGELICRGPYTIRGYYNAPERNKEAFTPDGYYKSGDLAKMDEHGNMTWCGRIKDCVDRGGEKVNAEEVESHVSQFPKVRKTAVVGMPDRMMGERICAFVVPQPGETFTLEELQRFLLSERQIAKFKVPERLEFLDEFPVTGVGKLDKKALREKIAQILKSEGKI